MLLLLALPWMLAQDLVLDYPKFQPDLDTVYVDFKVVDNGKKVQLGVLRKESLSISETGYNGLDDGTLLVDVQDIRNYDPDYDAGNYSMIVLADRCATVTQLQAQHEAITKLYQGFPKAHFYLSAMDAVRTPTTEIKDYYQLNQWLDSCLAIPSSQEKFIYKALASVLEEVSKTL